MIQSKLRIKWVIFSKLNKKPLILSSENQGYNWKEDESNMRPAVLFHGNIKSHIYKSAKTDKNLGALTDDTTERTFTINRWVIAYMNVSANDDIKWKNADTNFWDLSDKFEKV